MVGARACGPCGTSRPASSLVPPPALHDEASDSQFVAGPQLSGAFIGKFLQLLFWPCHLCFPMAWAVLSLTTVIDMADLNILPGRRRLLWTL